jgi:hypothetical protein
MRLPPLPPPPKRRLPVPPLPSSPVRAIRVEDGPPLTTLPPGSHARRVTLNLLRYAACCPVPLRPVLHKLSLAGWQIGKLEKIELETIYAYVDDQIAEKAKGEYVADLSTIVDHCLADGLADGVCLLCGHQHTRWEFTLKNTAGGLDHKTGSTCIEEYGLNVDGAATAEEALAMLRGAIAKAKKKAIREDWQKAHPDHVAQFAEFAAQISRLGVYRWLPWQLRRHIDSYTWGKQTKAWLMAAKAIAKYYAKEEFLTPSKTEKLFAPNGLLELARVYLADLDRAFIAAGLRTAPTAPAPATGTPPTLATVAVVDNTDLPF